MKLTEFYPEKQGRPGTRVALDLDTHGPSIPYGYIKGVMLDASMTGTEETENFIAGSATVILANGNIAVTLPSAGISPGRYYYIKNVGNSSVTVEGDVSAETIDGETSIFLTLQYSYVMVYCDGTVWHILGGANVKLETLFEEKQDEMINLLTQLLLLTWMNNLHFASMSDQTVNTDDIDEVC